jgi:adenylosuccinate lyase
VSLPATPSQTVGPFFSHALPSPDGPLPAAEDDPRAVWLRGMPWHADRGPVAELAGALGQLAVATGKIAGDVVLLAQTEVGEVQAAAGGSSTLPHKRNPVDAAAMRANLARTGGLLVSERVTTALTGSLGRLAAHDLVTGAAARSTEEGRPLVDVLDEDPAIQLPRAELEALLDPTEGLEPARALVARALTARRTANG